MSKALSNSLIYAYDITTVGVLWLTVVVLAFVSIVILQAGLNLIGVLSGQNVVALPAIFLFSLLFSGPGVLILSIGVLLIWRAQ